MVQLKFEGIRRLLFIGAHSDDIEIGCGGFIIQNADRINELGIEVDWVVCTGSESVRKQEAQKGFEAFSGKIKKKTIQILDFEDGVMLMERTRLRQTLANLPVPDMVFTHYLEDRHQDHRFVSEMTHNAFRRSYVLEYEVIKYDWDLGNPTCFVVLDGDTVDRKAALLMDCFGSQRSKDWFDEETFKGLARIRGVQCHAPYAEGFYARKNVLTL